MLAKEAQDLVKSLEWRGNVRQLRNFCERLVIIAHSPNISRDFILKQYNSAYDLSEQTSPPSVLEVTPSKVSFKDDKISTEVIPEEKAKILQALEKHNGVKKLAAQELNISTVTLWRKLEKYNIGKSYS